MAQEALFAIKDIGYSGSITDVNLLHQALDGGPKSIPYTQLIHFVTNELRPLCNIDEQVNAITSGNDSSTFLMELSSFLKELGCPYESLIQGHLSDRLTAKRDKLLLVTYLVSELMAARMCPMKKTAKAIELKLQESPHAFHLRHLLQAFGFSKPPADLTIQSLFQKLTPTVDKAVKSVPPQLLSAPALNATLTVKQWEALSRVQTDLHAEYTIRREMLLKRLDCTIQSFQWSDRTRGKESEIGRVYTVKREQLSTSPDVSVADLLCAREDLAILEKTSNASVRKNTKSAVNRVIIGQVPDRGGRSWEQAPPPPEMPSWQQRSGPGFGDQRGGGRGGGGRGGGGDRGGYRGGGHDSGRGNYNSQNSSFASSSRNNQDRPSAYGNNQSGYNNRHRPQSDTTKSYSHIRVDSKSSLGNMSVYAAYQASLNDFKNTSISSGDTNTDKRDYTTSFGGDKTGNKRTNTFHSDKGTADKSERSSAAAASWRSYSTGNSSYSSSSSGGASNYQRQSSGGFDSAGSYSSNNQKPAQQQIEQRGSFDSAGTYGGGGSSSSRQHEDSKRHKSYDSFQTTGNMTQADQYVQESNQNQQYRSGRGSGGGGRGGRSRGGSERYNSGGGGGYNSGGGGGYNTGRNNYY